MYRLILALCLVFSCLLCVPVSAGCPDCGVRSFPVARKIVTETGRRIRNVLAAAVGRRG